jgi:hypothetical protein
MNRSKDRSALVDGFGSGVGRVCRIPIQLFSPRTSTGF